MERVDAPPPVASPPPMQLPMSPPPESLSSIDSGRDKSLHIGNVLESLGLTGYPNPEFPNVPTLTR